MVITGRSMCMHVLSSVNGIGSTAHVVYIALDLMTSFLTSDSVRGLKLENLTGLLKL